MAQTGEKTGEKTKEKTGEKTGEKQLIISLRDLINMYTFLIKILIPHLDKLNKRLNSTKKNDLIYVNNQEDSTIISKMILYNDILVSPRFEHKRCNIFSKFLLSNNLVERNYKSAFTNDLDSNINTVLKVSVRAYVAKMYKIVNFYKISYNQNKNEQLFDVPPGVKYTFRVCLNNIIVEHFSSNGVLKADFKLSDDQTNITGILIEKNIAIALQTFRRNRSLQTLRRFHRDKTHIVFCYDYSYSVSIPITIRFYRSNNSVETYYHDVIGIDEEETEVYHEFCMSDVRSKKVIQYHDIEKIENIEKIEHISREDREEYKEYKENRISSIMLYTESRSSTENFYRYTEDCSQYIFLTILRDSNFFDISKREFNNLNKEIITRTYTENNLNQCVYTDYSSQQKRIVKYKNNKINNIIIINYLDEDLQNIISINFINKKTKTLIKCNNNNVYNIITANTKSDCEYLDSFNTYTSTTSSTSSSSKILSSHEWTNNTGPKLNQIITATYDISLDNLLNSSFQDQNNTCPVCYTEPSRDNKFYILVGIKHVDKKSSYDRHIKIKENACGHVLCNNCINGIQQNNYNNNLRCPICKSDVMCLVQKY